MNNLRNFCIIAHIDHGKSTLADRILELTGVVATTGNEQILDGMDLERERGITIKSSPIRIPYKSKNGDMYILNLIDTPGHVDFNYEVSRSLRACEGAILLVDAAQGVQAQTVSNAYRAIDAGLEIIPVINKIDLPGAMLDECCLQLEDMLGLPVDDALMISARQGTGIPELLEAIVARVPPPQGDGHGPLKCLVFDSQYDPYRGVILHIRLFSGRVASGDRIMIKSTGKSFEVAEVGYFGLQLRPCQILEAGDVGYLSAMIRDVADISVGDTVISPDYPETEAVPGLKPSQPMVFCGLYPIDTNDYAKLQAALERFRLNDSSVVYEKESSAALGHGFRAGFLGMLHMEIALERLRREHEQDLIATLPSVVYKVVTKQGEALMIDNPSKFPPALEIDHMEEPVVRARLILPTDSVGPCMELSQSKRGTLISMEHPDERRTLLVYDFPLAEIIVDFHDRLKSVSRGYASMDYEMAGYHPADLAKVDILVNGDPVDALSCVCLRQSAAAKGRALIRKLRQLIPRQQFKVALQAAIGGTVVAREDVAPLRKDVLAKCYGGDVTRKRKLLEKQREGKKRMKMIGSVELPQEAFFSLLKVEE
ncbi:MAG: elongation factor 4 [Chloroflexi bacterium RBG_13_54_8]|nr:MAG: elongation factor 4 [Chloroflexi bacterium RBG_13_54_8]